MKRKRFWILIPFVIFCFSCEKVSDYYFGITMQPEFLEDDFIPGLNIFGIIRPDAMNGINRSFVHVQKVIRAVGDTSELEVKSAAVWVYASTNGMVSDTFQYTLQPDTSAFRSYKPAQTFLPAEGEEYELKCVAGGLPELWAVTRMPFQPEIENLIVSSGEVIFDIIADTTAYMYMIYLVKNTMVFNNITILPSWGTDTHISLDAEISEGTEIIIYAYDENLASYIANSNTSYNINKFRQYDNQVEDGYGVFGSLNFLHVFL